MEKEKLFYTMEASAVLKDLESSSEGLTEAQAQTRIERYGKNELQEENKKSLFVMFLEQFKNLMVIILIIAAVISLIATKGEDLADALIIFAVVLINAILGVVQENKAEKALAALKSMSSPFVKVKRQGEVRQIKTQELVPGDIVLIEAGDIVPADMRLIENVSLKIEEAALTGESVPVEKQIQPLDKTDLVIGDRTNMGCCGNRYGYRGG